MIRYYALALTLVFIGFNLKTEAQVNSNKYKQAEDLMNDENYNKALSLYQELLQQAPNNANLNFKIGYCYLNTATQKTKAISYLEFASSHISPDYNGLNPDEENVPLEVLFYLGKAYHVNYRFDDAERTFYELKKQVSATEKEFLGKINHELEACQYARVLMKSPVEMTVSNLGKQINSVYTEHSPVISGDESILVFTSKREGNTGNVKTDDGQYTEDIYISTFNGKSFNQAIRLDGNINTPGHEASVGLSFDGSQLFIYRDDDGDGNLYISKRSGDKWELAEPLPPVINSKSRETHASMSFDGNEIYFTSDRKGGYGGLDIYRVRKLPNGSWSKAQNMGPEINTPYDEEGPYLHPDGTSLFFASKGHNTMGGYDIFVSYYDAEKDRWLKPENIGYPINTPDDDVYYVPSVDGRRAYYASYANNSIGYYDIFRIDLSEAHVRNQTVIAGIAKVRSGDLLENPVVTISTMDDEMVGIYTPDVEKKKFLVILPRGRKYKVQFESSNYDPFEKIILVPEFSYDQSGKVVMFDDIVIGGNEPYTQDNLALQKNDRLDKSAKDQNLLYKEGADQGMNSLGLDSRYAQQTQNGESYYNGSDGMNSEDGTTANNGVSNPTTDGDNISVDVTTDGKSIGDGNSSAFGNNQKNDDHSVVGNHIFSNGKWIYYLLGLLAILIFGYFARRKMKD